MEKTGSYGKDGHLWKRRTLMEKTDTCGKDGHLWKSRGVGSTFKLRGPLRGGGGGGREPIAQL